MPTVPVVRYVEEVAGELTVEVVAVKVGPPARSVVAVVVIAEAVLAEKEVVTKDVVAAVDSVAAARNRAAKQIFFMIIVQVIRNGSVPG